MHRILKILLLIMVLTLSGTVLFAVEKQEMQKGGRMPDSGCSRREGYGTHPARVFLTRRQNSGINHGL